MPSLRACKYQLTFLCNRFEKYTTNTPVNALNEAYYGLNVALERFRACLDDLDEDELIKQEVDFDTYCDRAEDIKLHLIKIGAVPATTDTSPKANNDQLSAVQKMLGELMSHRLDANTTNIRLPKLNIPQFTGLPDEWIPFNDFFTSTVHENEAISDIQKFQYLRSALSGEAAKAISGIAISDDNYAIAWQRLRNRYDRPARLINNLIRTFVNEKSVSSSLSNLKTVVCTAQNTIDLLSSISPYATSRDPWVIYLTLEKLDTETKKLWVRKSSTIEEPSLRVFFKFLEQRCDELDIEAAQSSAGCRRSPIRVNAAVTVKCIFCQADHHVMKCSAFLKNSPEARERFASENSRCFNCLGTGHSVRTCSSKYNCSICRSRHHTLLHKPASNSQSPKPDHSETLSLLPSPEISPGSSDDVVRVLTCTHSATSSILPTAVLNLKTDSRQISVRALLDTGSQSNFISEALVNRLGLRRNQVRIPIGRLGEERLIHSRGSVNVMLGSRFNPSESTYVKAHVLPTVISRYPSRDVPITRIDYLSSHFDLADPSFFKASEVDMILGGSFVFEILKTERFICITDQLYLQNTRVGYIACSKASAVDEPALSNLAIAGEADHLDVLLERFWASEEAPLTAPCLSADDRRCEQIFQKTTHRLSDGRFCTSLPFSSDRPIFHGTYHTALRRLALLERRFKRDEKFKYAYHDFMTEYRELGHMSLTSLDSRSIEHFAGFVTPHHGVLQHGTKLRVVFDASAKDLEGRSLNDQLLCGPSLQAHITDVITRFRTGRYALSCDIAKMYRQIIINENDRDYQLILWRDSDQSPVRIYRLNTVTYGQKSSPFLALRVLNEIASISSQSYPHASRILSNNRYVDDLLFTADTIPDALRVRDELISVLSQTGFQLRKWIANDPNLVRDFPVDQIAEQFSFTEGDEPAVQTLGVRWIPSCDAFSYNVSLASLVHFSKRNLVADTARLYDPLGWITPVIVKLKILIQEAWVAKLTWDAELPHKIVKEWQNIRSSLHLLRNVRIGRFLTHGAVEIHGFSDSSKWAYAAAVYSRVLADDGTISTRLLIAKSKVAPIRTISIPRLELCGAHLLAKLIPTCLEPLNLSYKDVTLWTDSTTVLAWLKSVPRRWTTFVANRVGDIHSRCPNVRWRHIASHLNPADSSSRGMYPETLISSRLWWFGPDVLLDKELSLDPDLTFDTSEEAVTRAYVATTESPFWLEMVVRFSNFNRLIRSCAFILKFRDILIKRERSDDDLSTVYISRALQFLIKQMQSTHFSHELSSLESGKGLSKSSVIRTLCPFIDSEGILRANTRLLASDSATICASPIILPNCHFSDLLIRKAHYDNLHAGPLTMSSIIRQNYWVPGLLRSVKRFYRSCPVCTRFNARTASPIMGALPPHRINDSKPFAVSGVDFAGPILVRPYHGRGNITLKSYIALFVCAATKAVHLELVMSMSVTSFVMALKRFLSRRGRCHVMYSDNGRSFLGCRNALREFSTALELSLSHSDLKSFLNEQLIDWKFIPPYSPHFGGLWESGIRQVKHHLNKCLTSAPLTFEELQTVLTQIEGILNSRPLAPVSFVDAEIPLTPSHLLTGYPTASLPEIFEPSESNSVVRHRQTLMKQAIASFWNRWRSEYLPTLMRRPKWLKGSAPLSIGDVVIIKRGSDPPRRWALGRIVQLFNGPDGVSRVAEIQSNGSIRREAIRNLIPLNVEPPVSTGGSMDAVADS